MKQIGNHEYTDEQMLKIEEYKTLIRKMQKDEDDLYEELLKNHLTLKGNDGNILELAKRDEEFLFDYIFNDLKYESR